MHWQSDRHLQLICSYCNKALGPKWSWSCEGQWPYFDLSAAAGVSTPYSFMLVSGALAVSSGHVLCDVHGCGGSTVHVLGCDEADEAAHLGANFSLTWRFLPKTYKLLLLCVAWVNSCAPAWPGKANL